MLESQVLGTALFNSVEVISPGMTVASLSDKYGLDRTTGNSKSGFKIQCAPILCASYLVPKSLSSILSSLLLLLL